MSNSETQTLRFDIDASVVFQLGANLITDDAQALLELIKNAYDADSKRVRIVINTKDSPPPPSKFADATGYILVEDSGHGMNLEAIKRGWLVISGSSKRKLKEEGRVTQLERHYLGDKGLGRLSTQRLGNNLELFTRPAGEKVEHRLGFSWQDFARADVLSQVELSVVTVTTERRPGTQLIVSELRDRGFWGSQQAAEAITVELSKLIFPYGSWSPSNSAKGAQQFEVNVTLNGQQLDLIGFSKQARRLAQAKYVVRFEPEGELVVQGYAKLGFLRTKGTSKDSERERADFDVLVEADGGQRFFEFLRQKKASKDLELARGDTSEWFVQTTLRKNLDAVDKVRTTEDQLPANPGPFESEFDVIFYTDVDSDGAESDLSSQELDKYIKAMAGIRIYRDGFGIRVDEDWLGLGKAFTKGSSYYALRPRNVLGYVKLSVAHNSLLRELTNREGFERTPHYENFVLLMEEAVKRASLVNEHLRRGWREFREHIRREETGLNNSAKRPSGELRKRLNSVKKVKVDLESSRRKIAEELTQVKTHTSSGDGQIALFDAETRLQQLEAQETRLLKLVDQAQELVATASRQLGEIDDGEALLELLERENEVLKEQAALMYETVSLGISAEALSHELFNITDRIHGASKDYEKHLNRSKSTDTTAFSFVNTVLIQVNALRKQLTRIEPSLRYVREQREEIPLGKFLAETTEYFTQRFDQKPIRIALSQGSHGDFAVRMNRGKLLQVVDNLLLNSEYWIEHWLRVGRLAEGVMNLRVDAPALQVWDNGLGIDPSVEESLFEPFVTTKQAGRGLGLYIANQLMLSDGCSIRLLPERNKFERRYKFEIDLSGTMYGKQP